MVSQQNINQSSSSLRNNTMSNPNNLTNPVHQSKQQNLAEPGPKLGQSQSQFGVPNKETTTSSKSTNDMYRYY